MHFPSFGHTITRALIVVLIALTPFFLFAQDESSWYVSKELTNNNLLPQNSVRALYFDKNSGFLWMTTEAGIVRYDGVSTAVFDKRQLKELTTIRMGNFLYSFKEGLLVTDRDGTVCRIKDGNVYTEKSKTISKVNIAPSFTGNLASLQQCNDIYDGVEQLKSETEKKDPSLMLVNSPFAVLNLDSATWYSYSQDKFLLFNGKKRMGEWPKRPEELPVLVDKDRTVYAINNDGSYYVLDADAKTCQRKQIENQHFNPATTSIHFDYVNHQPLLLDKDNLYQLIFSKGEVAVEFVAHLPSLPRLISAIVMHPDGSQIYVASVLDGVKVYEKNIFRIYSVRGLFNIIGRRVEERGNIYALATLDNNHVFTSTSVSFNLTNGEAVVLPYIIERPQTMLRDSAGNIWYSSGDSLVVFDAGSKRVKKVFHLDLAAKQPGHSNFLQVIYAAKTGKIWLSTYFYLGYIQGDSIIKVVDFPKKLGVCFAYMQEDASGKIYGGNSDGIYLVDDTRGSVSKVTNIPAKNIRYFHFDDRGYCWITTYGTGIFLYDIKQKRSYELPVDSKGYLLYSHALCEDGKGNFIIPTNRGLFRISIEHMITVALNNEKELLYQYFDINNGLVTNEFNGGCQPAYLRMPTGDLLLPSFSGLVRVLKNNLTTPANYPIYISAISDYYGTFRLPGDSITEARLPSQLRNIEVELAQAQWGQNAYRGISYKLDNGEWIHLDDGSQRIRLIELASGEHKLLIKARAALSPGIAANRELHFSIEKQFIETAWFKVIVIVGIALVAALVAFIRTWRLQRKNQRLAQVVQEKTKELQDKNSALSTAVGDLNMALGQVEHNERFLRKLIGVLGHDIMTPLQYIGRVSNQLINYGNRLKPETTTEAVNDISSTASQLYYMSENIIHWIKIQEGLLTPDYASFNVHILVNELFNFHRRIAAEKKNQLFNDVGTEFTCTQDQIVVKVILNNLLLNANKYTAGGQIRVAAGHEGKIFWLSVQDTGMGMDEETVDSLNKLVSVTPGVGTAQEMGWGLGYTLIIDMVKFMKAKLLVESAKGKGTKVTIHFIRMQF